MNDKTRVQIAFITTISCLGASIFLLFMIPLPRVRMNSLEHLEYHLFLSIPLIVDVFILLALRIPSLLKERKEKKEKKRIETRYKIWIKDMTDLLDFEKEMMKQHESDKEKARQETETLISKMRLNDHERKEMDDNYFEQQFDERWYFPLSNQELTQGDEILNEDD